MLRLITLLPDFVELFPLSTLNILCFSFHLNHTSGKQRWKWCCCSALVDCYIVSFFYSSSVRGYQSTSVTVLVHNNFILFPACVICAIVPWSQRFATGSPDMSLLAGVSRRQLVVAGKMQRGKHRWITCIWPKQVDICRKVCEHETCSISTFLKDGNKSFA